METDLSAILIAVITALTGASAWKFYERKFDRKREDELQYRFECKSRIEKLEFLLKESAEEKDELREKILILTAQVAELTAKIQYLEKNIKA